MTLPEIYLDANATSAVLPAAIAAADQVMRHSYGNPSSSHATGLTAKATLDAVRQRARRLLGVGEGALIFTSGATEGIQTAVLSALMALRERRAAGQPCGALLLYGATEHKAVPESLAHWNRLLGLDLELRALPVDANGRHRLDLLRDLAPRAAMVCTMAANNETGVISDLAAIAALLAECAPQAYWMVDSVQALGKMDLDLAATRIDYAPFSGHKLYAPKGIGMLYVRAGAPYTALMAGGGQEAGQRSGTENMAGVAALGAVLAALEDGVSLRSHAQLAAYRERLAGALRDALPGVLFNAPFEASLPTTLNFSVPGFAGKELLDLFDAAGIRVSAGSACSAAKALPSYVLEAMQVPAWRCSAAVRMSFGPMADDAFIEAACARIARCGQALRESCLIASSVPAASRDGVIQLVADGACTWLVLDAASRSCAVIDPQPALVARIADFVRCQRYQLRAVLATQALAPVAAARLALLAALAEGADAAPVASADALGWPLHSAAMVLQGGLPVDALALGERMLARLPQGGSATYLLGAGADGAMPAASVRFAFTGQGAHHAALAGLVSASAILCPAQDAGNVACTTLAAENGAAMAEEGDAMQLAPDALAAFLRAHPDAQLIDVREAFEHAVGSDCALQGFSAQSVPLSRLADRLADWLRAEHTPLVFFCRSGGRSLKAAHCLQRLGHRQAWSVTGGLALGNSTQGALPIAA